MGGRGWDGACWRWLWWREDVVWLLPLRDGGMVWLLPLREDLLGVRPDADADAEADPAPA